MQAPWPDQYPLAAHQLAELMASHHLDEEEIAAASYALQVAVAPIINLSWYHSFAGHMDGAESLGSEYV